MIKKCMAMLACLMMLISGAVAEEAPLQISVTGQILQSSRLTEEGLRIANRLLERLMIRKSAWEDGERAEVWVDGRPFWSVERRVNDEGTLVLFMDANAYHTQKGETDALMILTGQKRTESNPLFDPGAYAAAAGEIYALLDAQTQPVEKKNSTDIENAVSSPRYDLYTLTKEQLQSLWPQMVQAARPYFDRDGGEGELWQQAADVQITSDEVRIKRLYNKDGNDMGLQLTGNGLLFGTERKISLLMGYTPGRGGSLTLTARALQGKDNLKITGTLKERVGEEKTTYALSCEYSNRLQDETKTGEFTLNLENAQGVWTGKALWESDGKTMQIEPALQKVGDAWQGALMITVKEKKNVQLQAQLDILTAPWEKAEMPDVPVMEMTGMNQTQVTAALYPEEMTLMRAFIYLMNDLTDGERWLLTHELRTEDWHTGDEVPLADESETWIVKEETP